MQLQVVQVQVILKGIFSTGRSTLYRRIAQRIKNYLKLKFYDCYRKSTSSRQPA